MRGHFLVDERRYRLYVCYGSYDKADVEGKGWFRMPQAFSSTSQRTWENYGSSAFSIRCILSWSKHDSNVGRKRRKCFLFFFIWKMFSEIDLWVLALKSRLDLVQCCREERKTVKSKLRQRSMFRRLSLYEKGWVSHYQATSLSYFVASAPAAWLSGWNLNKA